MYCVQCICTWNVSFMMYKNLMKKYKFLILMNNPKTIYLNISLSISVAYGKELVNIEHCISSVSVTLIYAWHYICPSTFVLETLVQLQNVLIVKFTLGSVSLTSTVTCAEYLSEYYHKHASTYAFTNVNFEITAGMPRFIGSKTTPRRAEFVSVVLVFRIHASIKLCQPWILQI